MKKVILLTVAVAMFIALPLTSANAVEVFSAETELRQYNPEKSYGGYFMPSNSRRGTNYLLDMTGNVVHEWDNNTGPTDDDRRQGATAQLLPNGNLGCMGRLTDWDSNYVWTFNPSTDANRPDIKMHHDTRWIWNKKLNAYTNLIVCNRTTTQDEIVAAGGDPSVDYSSRLDRMDVLIEVNQNKEIIWEWEFLDHTCQSQNPTWPNYVSDVALAPGKCDIFWKTDQSQPAGLAGIVRDWHHVNSVDYNEDLDVIAVNAKHFSTFFVIDHGETFVSTTDWAANRAAAAGPDGDFIYRFGNPSAYNQGLAPSFRNEGEQQIYGAHNIQWIRDYHWERPHPEAGDNWPDPSTVFAETMPGAGNFLIYDNGCYNPTVTRSRVREINPFLNDAGVNTGWFVNPPDAGYTGTVGATQTSKQIVWSYESRNPNSFYSRHISGAQRLPNGNTSINSGTQGHMFEVTPDGEVVWEYLYPGVAGPDAKTIRTDSDSISMFRHYRYGTDYPGLAGKDLSPIDTLTGRLPRQVGEDQTYPTSVPITGWGIPPDTSSEAGGGVGTGGSGGTGY